MLKQKLVLKKLYKRWLKIKAGRKGILYKAKFVEKGEEMENIFLRKSKSGNRSIESHILFYQFIY